MRALAKKHKVPDTDLTSSQDVTPNYNDWVPQFTNLEDNSWSNLL